MHYHERFVQNYWETQSLQGLYAKGYCCLAQLGTQVELADTLVASAPVNFRKVTQALGKGAEKFVSVKDAPSDQYVNQSAVDMPVDTAGNEGHRAAAGEKLNVLHCDREMECVPQEQYNGHAHSERGST